ncbi:phage tail tape measure protein [Salinicoccus sesuvii]|uniref:lysostaphin n=1 Tax=Salinicoccus sesuvii TaxID=868281 RepID=A0ABV7N4T8_9STAP
MAEGRIQGLSVGLGMESTEITRSMSEIKRSFRGLNSEAKVTSNNFKYGSRDAKTYKSTIDSLSDTTEKQRKNVEALGKRYQDVVEDQGASSKAAQTLATEYNKQADNLNRLENELSNVKSEFEEFNEAQRIAESRWTKAGESMDKFGDKTQKVGRGMQDVGKKVSLAVTTPILGFAAAAIKTGVDFDDSMAKVAAVSGATGDDLEALRQKAKDMGESTRFSASEAADGLNYMALAGWSTEEMLGGLDGVMSLAAASGEDLGSVSDIVTDSLSAFGLEAKDSSYFADVLAQTSANANTDVTGLGDAFKYVAPVAGAMGYTVEDTAKAIGLMSDSGIKGEKAGTALRTMMTNLAKPTKAMQEEMDNLGISLTNTDGSMKTFDEIMVDLRSSFSGLNEEQQASAAATIFGKEAMSGALAVINTTGDSFDDLGNKISNSEGAAKKMADTMEGTLGGVWREIKSGIEGFSISVYETMLPTLEKMSEKILNAIQWLNDLSPRAKTLGVVFAGVAAAIGPLLVVGGSLLIFFGSILKTLAPVMTNIAKAGGLLKYLRFAFIGLTGPVGITVGVIAGLATAFMVAYQRSETFRNFIRDLRPKFVDAWKGVMEFKDKVLQAVSGITAMFKNDWMAGMSILQKMGMGDDQILKVQNGVIKVKRFFHDLKQGISAAFSSIGSFASDMFGQIKSFWQSDGQQTMTAFGNAINLIKSGVSFAMPYIQKTVSVALKLTLSIVKMVWQNIQGIIRGGLNIVMGLTKVFTGIFTGDFSKMWEGVKQTFKGSIQLIWNGFQLLFYGRIIKGVGSLVKIFAGSIRSLWTRVVGFFKGMADGVASRMTGMRTGVTQTASNLVSRVVQFFKNLHTNLTVTAGNIRSGVQRPFSAMREFVSNSVSRLREGAVNGFTRLKERATKMVTDLKDNVSDRFGDIVKGARELPGKMGSAITNAKGKAVDGIKSLGSSMLSQLEKVINFLIDGMNNVLGKLGIKDLIGNVTLNKGSNGSRSRASAGGYQAARLSTGGELTRDTMAIVNDKGPGNGRNGFVQEIIERRDGKLEMPKGRDVLVGLGKGDTVHNGATVQALKMSGMLPRFSTGIGSGTDKKNEPKKKKGLWGTIGDVMSNAWDYIKHPGKALSAIVDSISPDWSSLGGFAKTAAKGAFGFAKDKALDWLTGIFKDNEGGEVNGSSILGRKITAKFGKYPAAIARQLGVTDHYGLDTAHRYEKLTSPVSGKVSRVWHDKFGGNAIQISAGDLTWWFMHMQSIARKVGDMVKAGSTSLGITGNTGLRTTGYHLHTQAMKGGIGNRFAINPLPLLQKANSHLLGGRTLTDGLFNLHGGEYIINPKKPTEAMKLLALAGKELTGKSKQTRQLPTPTGGGGDTRNLENKLDQLIELMGMMLTSSQNIEQKENVLDARSLSNEFDKLIQSKHRLRNRYSQ